MHEWLVSPPVLLISRCLSGITPSCLVQLLCKTIPIQDEKDMAMRLILNLLIFLDGHYATRARFSLYSRWVVMADYWYRPSDCSVH